MENQSPIAEGKTHQVKSPPSTEAEPKSALLQRRAFMRLTLAERRRLLAQQAQEMSAHYQQNTQWQELETGDIIDY